MKSGPNFASKYTIVEIGCGSSCRFAFIADNTNGEVFNFPYGGEDNLDLEFVYNNDSNFILVSWLNYEEKLCETKRIYWDGRAFSILESFERKQQGDDSWPDCSLFGWR